MSKRKLVLGLKAAVWALGLFPLAQAAWWLRDGVIGLGANPIEKVLLHSGWWTLVLLLVTLSLTPLRRITGRNELVKLRRPTGLFAFFWATVHFGIYLGLDQVFAWSFILEDVAERPFITVGFAAWLILLALAFTSTRGWIRRLGRSWTRLHRAVYLAGLLGVIHFYWRVKADTREPLIFAAVFLALMAFRAYWGVRQRRARSARSAARRASGSGDVDPARAAGSGASRRDAAAVARGSARRSAVEEAHARDGAEGREAFAGADRAAGAGAGSG